MSRINLINPFSGSFDLLLGSSGRAGELFSFFENREIMEVGIGSGSGFSYEWNLGYDSMQGGEIKGYFHMTPANYLAAGGLICLLPFLWMTVLPFRASELPVDKETQAVAFGLGVFCIVQSFFRVNLVTDAISVIFIFGPMMLLVDRRASSLVPSSRAGQFERAL